MLEDQEDSFLMKPKAEVFPHRWIFHILFCSLPLGLSRRSRRHKRAHQHNDTDLATYTPLNLEEYQDFLMHVFLRRSTATFFLTDVCVCVCCSCCLQGVNRQTSVQSATGVFPEGGAFVIAAPHLLLLLPPLPGQLSVCRRHRLDHKCGGHVAGEREEVSASNQPQPSRWTEEGAQSHGGSFSSLSHGWNAD